MLLPYNSEFIPFDKLLNVVFERLVSAKSKFSYNVWFMNLMNINEYHELVVHEMFMDSFHELNSWIISEMFMNTLRTIHENSSKFINTWMFIAPGMCS